MEHKENPYNQTTTTSESSANNSNGKKRIQFFNQVVAMIIYQFQHIILLQVNLANEVKKNNLIRFSRRLFIDNVLNRVTSPVSSALRAEVTKK